MLRNLLNKGKCKLGFHQGEWQYSSSDSCRQTRICERCRTESTRIVHTWPEWQYASDESCELVCKCQRCSEIKRRTGHQWGQWEYAAPDSCVQVKTCARCHETKTGQSKHQWGEWQFVSVEKCIQMQSCTRCGEGNSLHRKTHSWDHWRYSESHHAPVHPCLRCGETTEQPEITVSKSLLKRKPTFTDISSSVNQVFYTNTDEGTRAAIHANKDILFSAAVDEFFRSSLQQSQQGPQVTANLKALWALLRQCQQIGIDAAIDERISRNLQIPAIEANMDLEQTRGAVVSQPVTDAPNDEDILPLSTPTPPSSSPTSRRKAPTQSPPPQQKSNEVSLRSQDEPREPPSTPETTQPEIQLDPRLPGQWRYTNTIFAGGVSMVSSTYMLLSTDGFFVRSREAIATGNFVDVSGSYAGTSFHSSDPSVKTGRWRVKGGEFRLYYDNDEQTACPYKVSYDSLLCITPAKKQLWERIN